MRNTLFLLLISLAFGCTTMQNTGEPAVYQSYDKDYGEPITKSLFQSNDRSLSEENIQRLLDGEIRLPENLRVAMLNYSPTSGSRYYSQYWRNEEYLKLQQSYLDTFTGFLGQSDRVQKIMVMPSLLANKDAKLIQMREAAVRLQADLLLIFVLRSDIYQRYRVFQKDEAKAYATCEALLLDIRTGMVPFSTIRTDDILVQKTESSQDIRELGKLAEKQAVDKVMALVGKELSGFLQEGE
ncbi:MAG: hypothetical protein AAFR61_18995 [Bacteroidota bacterium]